MTRYDAYDPFARIYNQHWCNERLADGGTFEFDLNMEEAYRTRWCGTFGYAEDDHACVVRGSRDDAERIGRIDLTMFVARKRTGVPNG